MKGYNSERFAVLTLEYNGYHVARRAGSFGIEDIIAFKFDKILLVQVKNTLKKHNSMTKTEKEILRLHANEFDAVPIFLYKNGRGKYVWYNLLNNSEMNIDSYTKKWYEERQIRKKHLKEINKKSKSVCSKYIIENWDELKNYICC